MKLFSKPLTEYQIEDDYENEWSIFHFYFFILLFKTKFIASNAQLYVPESVTLVDCQSNVFWSCVAIIIAVFLKKTAAIETIVVPDCTMVI